MTAPAQAEERIERAAWAVCPKLQFMLHGKERKCKQCKTGFYESVGRAGTPWCRFFAEGVVKDALKAGGYLVEDASDSAA